MKTTTSTKKRYKFNIINNKGELEPWTGSFKTSEEAEKWFEKHGKFHEDRNHRLVKVETTIEYNQLK